MGREDKEIDAWGRNDREGSGEEEETEISIATDDELMLKDDAAVRMTDSLKESLVSTISFKGSEGSMRILSEIIEEFKWLRVKEETGHLGSSVVKN